MGIPNLEPFINFAMIFTPVGFLYLYFIYKITFK